MLTVHFTYSASLLCYRDGTEHNRPAGNDEKMSLDLYSIKYHDMMLYT